MNKEKKRETPDRYRPDTKDGSAVWRQRKSFLLLHCHTVPEFFSPQAPTDKRLLLSCLWYWTSFLPGWPHIDDTLSIYSEHCEREHITIVHGPRGSRDKSIFCLFSQEAELTGTRLWLTFLLSRHPTLSQTRPEQAALLQLTSSWETQAQPTSGGPGMPLCYIVKVLLERTLTSPGLSNNQYDWIL